MTSKKEKTTAPRREELFPLLLAIELLAFIVWHCLHLGGFQWSTDEGIYLMRVRLMQQGYRLYGDIWTDQLPGLIELLRLAFAIGGTSVALGRAVIVMLAAVGLWGTASLTRRFAGPWGALVAVALLALAPNHYQLSRAMISPDLPSISVGAAGLALMGRHLDSGRRRWLTLSALVCAVALYIKATAVLAVAVAGLWLLWDVTRRRGWRAALWSGFGWGCGVVAPLALALALHDLPALWDQFVGAQIASGRMALKIGPHAVKILAYIGEHNGGLAALAAAGVLAVGFSLRPGWSRSHPLNAAEPTEGDIVRPRSAWVPLGWLGLSVGVLLLRSPMWPSHHLVVLLFPLAVLAGVGIGRLIDALRKKHWRVALPVALALCVYGISLPGILRQNGANAEARTFTSTLEAVAYLENRFPEGAVVISDYHMIPFRAGLTVPPELATVTKKRIQLGMLSSEALIEITQRHQPGAVILWDEQLASASEYVDWLRETHTMTFKRSYHDIYEPLLPDTIPYPQEATYGESLRLLGCRIDHPAVDPGGRLVVTLYYRVTAPITTRYRGFVHLIAPDGGAIAQQDQVAWGDHYPSTAWHVGETISDRYVIEVPSDAPAGPCLLSAGFYESESDTRLVARDGAGERLGGDQVILGARPVVRSPATYERPVSEHACDITFDRVARLVGYDIAVAEETLDVALVWQGVAPPEAPSYTAYVHLRDAAGLVAQHDSPPAEGQRPTVAWREGEYVVDRHRLSLSDVPAGNYALYVGLYDPATGERVLTLDAAGAALPSGETRLQVPVTVGGAR